MPYSHILMFFSFLRPETNGAESNNFHATACFHWKLIFGCCVAGPTTISFNNCDQTTTVLSPDYSRGPCAPTGNRTQANPELPANSSSHYFG